jgi:hypothetical protein
MPPTMDGTLYWGQLFNKDRSPTDLLQDLLYGIAQYIVSGIFTLVPRTNVMQSSNIEPRNLKYLTPEKLANFYRGVGVNMDGKLPCA